jgi:tight adherence protein C
MIRCVEQKKNPEESYLYTELVQAVNELKNNYSFSQVLEDFSKRCSVQEVSIFTTTVLLNYRRGGAEFVLALRDLSRTLWEKRKALSRTLGEQASSKLVFPMVLIFLVILLIVATPAIMLF